ncbi:MAG TPA: DUF262 domain-containing protein, partial [Polyangiaceae bacterium LLY-WYZ-15_(1-7)]|nr:DUF262 domain-containing protein [Polyangiaceae bacterium LLY-WYZ-15_(1-7)]
LQMVIRGVLDAILAESIEGHLVAKLRKLGSNDEAIVQGEAIHKVLPRPSDREKFFVALADAAPEPTASVFADARAFFAECAGAFLNDDHIPTDPYVDGPAVTSRASLLVATLLQLIKVVVIDLEDVDDAQVIFEALNARGTPLSATDLVKNLLFMRADRENANAEALYDVHWKRFDDAKDWWREVVGVGHAQRAREDVLMGNWLVAETGRTVNISRLYSEFRQWLEGDVREVEVALSQLSGYADAYEQMEGRISGASDREAEAFATIRSLGIMAATPLVLWLLVQREDKLDPSERELAIRAIESFVVRRMATKLQTRAYNQVFVDVLAKAQGADQSAGKAVISALKAGPNGYAWPDTTQLKEAFRTGRYYGAGGINRRRLALLLGAIDARLQAAAAKSEPLTIDYSGLTVEHVIPQKWRAHWPVTLDDEAERIRGEHRREARVHCIGNLTLVTGSLNPSLSNDPWKAKRAQLKEHSHLKLNALLCENDTWDEDAIEERGEWLAGQLSEVWPGPEADRWG